MTTWTVIDKIQNFVILECKSDPFSVDYGKNFCVCVKKDRRKHIDIPTGVLTEIETLYVTFTVFLTNHSETSFLD